MLSCEFIEPVTIGWDAGLAFVVAALQPPHIEPVCRGGCIHAEQIECHRKPFVDVLLNEISRHLVRFHNSCETGVAGQQVIELFLKHRRHACTKRLEAGMIQHRELIFPVAIHQLGVAIKIQPVLHILIECAE